MDPRLQPNMRHGCQSLIFAVFASWLTHFAGNDIG